MTKDGGDNFSPSSIESLDLSTLRIDDTYQRPLKVHHAKIVKQFNPQAAQPLTVGERDDLSLWVIDGQQRLAAMRKLNITHWPCLVVPSSGPAFEAALCRTLNGGDGTVKKLTVRELFKVRLASGCPVAHATKRAIEAGGLKLSMGGHNSYPNLTCLAKLYSLTRTYGEEAVRSACEVIVEAWRGGHHAMDDFIFHAIVMAVANPRVQRGRLVSRLQTTPPLAIYEETKSGVRNSAPTRAYAAIIKAYNKGLRSSRVSEEWNADARKGGENEKENDERAEGEARQADEFA